MDTYNVFTLTFDNNKQSSKFFLNLGTALRNFEKITSSPGTERATFLLVTPLDKEQVLSFLRQIKLGEDAIQGLHCQKTVAQLTELLPDPPLLPPHIKAKEACRLEDDTERAEVLMRKQAESNSARLLFIKWFKCAPFTVRDFVYLGYKRKGEMMEELKFVADYNCKGFQVKGRCPKCGGECWSKTCTTLGKLGRQIEPGNFIPDSEGHTCPKPSGPEGFEAPPTPAETLLLALEDYIEARIEAGISDLCQCCS